MKTDSIFRKNFISAFPFYVFFANHQINYLEKSRSHLSKKDVLMTILAVFVIEGQGIGYEDCSLKMKFVSFCFFSHSSDVMIDFESFLCFSSAMTR